MLLSILLSSSLIYNIRSTIDEQVLDSMELVSQCAIMMIGDKGLKNDDDYMKYFPSLMMVVRDFALSSVDQEGKPLTAKQYFEYSLEEQKGASDKIDSKNRIRRNLKTFF